MKKLEYNQKLFDLLGRLAHAVKSSNNTGYFDINTLSEDILIPIMSLAFSCPDLKNQNKIRMNYPAVDLGCSASRISIQVTSNASSRKIADTLQKFKSHNMEQNFEKLYIYVITEKQKKYASKALDRKIADLPIAFDKSQNIIDYRDIPQLLEDLDNKKIMRACEVLESAFSASEVSDEFQQHLDKFLKISEAQTSG